MARTTFLQIWTTPPGNCLRRLCTSAPRCRWTQLTVSSSKNAGNSPVRSTLWSLYSWHRLRLYLTIPCIASLACPKKGIVLERWSNGLSLMLEKMFGVRLISKLRAILLMEADFNAMNKEVYGVQMLDNAHKYKLISEEIFSKQNHTAKKRGVLRKHYLMILPVRSAPRPPLHSWTHLTVIIG